MSGMRGMRPNRRAIVIIAAAVALIILSILVYYLTRPHYVLKAVQVTEEPKLDGKADDVVWQKAEAVDIPVRNNEPVQLKCVYAGDRIFFTARFKDGTRDDIDEPWSYISKDKWSRGRTSDQFALFIDIRDSLMDFDRKGFEMMNFGFKPNLKIWEFGIKGKTLKKGYWNGYKQRADVWMMHSSISSPFGKGDDGIFQINTEYILSPTTTKPVLWMQWDQFDSPGMLILNTNKWTEAIKAEEGQTAESIKEDRPSFKYRAGLNIENTPYPYVADMEPINDFSTFKKGEKIPWVMFNETMKGSWGGSRADIDGKMRWDDGYWTVEMGRKLNTGHADDIHLRPEQKSPIYFGILMRTDGKTLNYSEPATLEFPAAGGN